MSPSTVRVLIASCLITAGLVGVAAANLGSEEKPEAEAVAPASVLPVVAKNLIAEDSFALNRTFSGQVQAGRQADLGFERGGRLMRVLVDEGDVVSRGQLVAELDTDRLSAQRAELEAARKQAESNLELAKITLSRFEDVVNKGGVSRQRLDEAREAERAADAALNLATQRLVTIDVELDKSQLKAPFTATVVSRLADEGRVLETGRPVVSLLERGNPEIHIGIAGRTLDYLRAGEKYTLDWRGQPVEATLRALLPLRLNSARTVEALFDPIDPPASMLAGDIVTISLQKEIKQSGFWIPLDALAEGERGLWSLFVAEAINPEPMASDATHRIVRRSADVVYQHGEDVFVAANINSDESVVTVGTHRIVPGQLVRLQAN